MVGHSGRFGCSYYLHPGISVKSEGDKKAVIRFIKGKNNYEIRRHENLLETYDNLKPIPINGIKHISCMIAADGFDLKHGFAIAKRNLK